MSYTQKMRSWVLTILGALLAMLLWRTAQGIGRETFDPTVPTKTKEEYAMKYAKFLTAVQQKGRKLEVNDDLEVSKSIQSASAKNDFTEAGALLDTLSDKYLTDDRMTALTALVDDARKRLAVIEEQVDKGKSKGADALDQVNSLSDPSALPAPSPDS